MSKTCPQGVCAKRRIPREDLEERERREAGEGECEPDGERDLAGDDLGDGEREREREVFERCVFSTRSV